MWWRLRVVKVVGGHGRKGDGLFLGAMFEGDGGARWRGILAWLGRATTFGGQVVDRVVMTYA